MRGRIIVAIACGALSIGAGALSIATAQEGAPVAERLATLDKDEAHKGVTQEARDRARAAIERSKRFRAAGDETHAKLSDRAAAAWISSAEDLVRTDDAEIAAESARRAAMDAGAESERERALLEETMLQNGRLRAELDQANKDLGRAPSTPPPPAAIGDGGAKLPKAPKAPALGGKDGGR